MKLSAIFFLLSLVPIASFSQVITSYELADEGNNVLKVSSTFDRDGAGPLVQDNSTISLFVPVGLTDPVVSDLQGGNWSPNIIDNATLAGPCGAPANGYYLLQISTNGQANLGAVVANTAEDLFTLSFSGSSNDPINGYDPSDGDPLSACVTALGIDNTASIDVDGNGGDEPTIGYSNVPISPVSIVLPVKLISFAAKAIDNTHADLRWLTAEERNADYFQLERSTDSRYWQAVGQVKAAGNSTDQRAYTFLDEGLYSPGQPTTFYYRLQIVDLDGYTEYSDVRPVYFQDQGLSSTVLYPNPTNGLTTLKLPETIENGYLEIHHVNGQLFLHRSLDYISSGGTIEFDTALWPAGQYLVRCHLNETVVHHRLQVIR